MFFLEFCIYFGVHLEVGRLRFGPMSGVVMVMTWVVAASVSIACSSSLDNLSVGVGYALKRVRISAPQNLLVAAIDSELEAFEEVTVKKTPDNNDGGLTATTLAEFGIDGCDTEATNTSGEPNDASSSRSMANCAFRSVSVRNVPTR